MADDLYPRIRAAIEGRLELARAADPGPWEVGPTLGAHDNRVFVRQVGDLIDSVGGTRHPVFTAQVANKTRFRENAAFIAANDPAWAIRALEADLSRLGDHESYSGRVCDRCSNEQWTAPWPCPEIKRLARVYLEEEA